MGHRGPQSSVEGTMAGASLARCSSQGQSPQDMTLCHLLLILPSLAQDAGHFHELKSDLVETSLPFRKT